MRFALENSTVEDRFADRIDSPQVITDNNPIPVIEPPAPSLAPAVVTPSASAFGTAIFYDGPYLDIPADGSTLTPSATSGTITFTASAITSINDGIGFQATDVGRLFRVFSEPLVWAAGTTYAAGAAVKEADVYWSAAQGSTGVQPSTDSGVNWVIDTVAAAWTWGKIASVISTTQFTATLQAAVVYPENVAGGNLLYTNPIIAWQLGVYSDTTGYPSVGTYHQGRIWLAGAVKNRFDASVSNGFGQHGYFNFAPTGRDGAVADNNGIAGTLNAAEVEDFLWMLPDEQGVLAGTQSGEWIIASSSAGEPITPTSILVREMTHYGSLNTPALKVGRATIFAHRDTRKVYEYMANYFTQKFVADNLSLKAKHLTTSGVAELAYMRELTPVIWGRLNNGDLIGCTYKHDDPIKPLEFAGWHRHRLTAGRGVISIQSGPANGGETDTLSMVTQDSTSGLCYVEFLQTVWSERNALLLAWYLDGGVVPAGLDYLAGKTSIRLCGLWSQTGQQVTVWGAGLDLGDFTVSAGGTIDIPLGAAGSLFTDALLTSIPADQTLPLSVPIAGTALGMPFVVGSTFISAGQILRPVMPQEGMTQTGPSLGKFRRATDAMLLLADAQGVSMGVDFLTMRPLAFKSPGGTVPLTLQQTYSGVYKGQVDADSNYDNMWCWKITRPYPCTVVAVEIQHKTNENV